MALPSAFKISCLPYGPFVAIPIILVLSAWIFAMVGSFGCNIFKICVNDVCADFGYKEAESLLIDMAEYLEYQDDDNFLLDPFDLVPTDGGRTGYDDNSCVGIPAVYIDEAMEAGRAMVIIVAYLGIAPLLASIATTFVTLPRKAFFGVASVCFFMAVVTGLAGTLGFAAGGCNAADRNNPFGRFAECRPAVGAVLTYAAFFLWIGAGVALLFTKKHEKEIPERHDIAKSPDITHRGVPDTSHSSYDPNAPFRLVEKDSFVQLDGSVVTTITTTDTMPDGSKNVTKVIERGAPPLEAQATAIAVPPKHSSYSHRPPPPVIEEDDQFDSDDGFSEGSEDATVVETDKQVKTKDDGTKVNTEIQTFTHRDKRRSSVKKVVLSKRLDDGSLKRKTTVIKTDKDGQKEKSSKVEVLDP